MRHLSKSKLMAYRQCPKRLWLEVHKPTLREDSAATQASFNTGHSVGEIARQLYDPAGKGYLIDIHTEGFEQALASTQNLLSKGKPVFEAGFRAAGALAFADVLLPRQKNGQTQWRMVEVKSSTSVKDYHRDDVAVQAYVAKQASVPLASVAVAHIDSSWVYPGNGCYAGLLQEEDLSQEAFAREEEVKQWIADAQNIIARSHAPEIRTGPHCSDPYECGFLGWCQQQEPQATHPVSWLPSRGRNALQEYIATHHVTEMKDIPDDLLNDKQRRVKKHTLSGDTFFDKKGAAAALLPYSLPGYFLDFETIQLAVPIWRGTRPYQQVPFQFSLHHLSSTGSLSHTAFLDLSGNDPSRQFAEDLIAACGEHGPVFVYHAGFETARINELAERFPLMAKRLLAINARVVDLLPIAREFYYHPSQQGSWSIKRVLPAACPDLRYSDLTGVQDGGMAMEAYQEAISPGTHPTRKAELEQQLLAYCQLDTFAMVRLWSHFSDHTSAVIL